jgi:hypothetical protein
VSLLRAGGGTWVCRPGVAAPPCGRLSSYPRGGQPSSTSSTAFPLPFGLLPPGGPRDDAIRCARAASAASVSSHKHVRPRVGHPPSDGTTPAVAPRVAHWPRVHRARDACARPRMWYRAHVDLPRTRVRGPRVGRRPVGGSNEQLEAHPRGRSRGSRYPHPRRSARAALRRRVLSHRRQHRRLPVLRDGTSTTSAGICVGCSLRTVGSGSSSRAFEKRSTRYPARSPNAGIRSSGVSTRPNGGASIGSAARSSMSR